MNIGIITSSPDFLKYFTQYGLFKKAINKCIITLNYWNPRDFINKKNKNIDSKIYSGVPGVVYKVFPLALAIEDAIHYYCNDIDICVIYLSPQGHLLKKNIIYKLLKFKSLIFICGKYSGIDQRIIQNYVDLELSIGDYILSNGEIALLVVIDVLVRFIPGVLNNINSVELDSFNNNCNLLSYPIYTRPKKFLGITVPQILLSGHHKYIQKWRFLEALKRTILNKPYLLNKIFFNKYQKKIFNKLKKYIKTLLFNV